MLNRLKASLALAPAILALLCWVARFAAAEEVTRIGVVQFVLWAAAAAFAIAYMVTLYISFVAKKLLG